MFASKGPLPPRNGKFYSVGIVARISGCANQKEVSLEDQVDHGHEVALAVLGKAFPIEYLTIATVGKGERRDRPELQEIEDLLRGGRLDLLVAEDLGRIIRGADAYELCGIAVDKKTRVISVNDGIDTDDPDWPGDVMVACREHMGHNSHTSKRIKHKKMVRFLRNGGSPGLPTRGYIKPRPGAPYSEWSIEPEATPVYLRWFEMLDEGLGHTAVSDWLNSIGFSPGPYVRSGKWTPSLVAKMTRNPLLKGMPAHGARMSVKVHETGQRVTVKNPDGPRYQNFPHLAHVPPEVFDAVNAKIREANAKLGRKPVDGSDPREGMSRKRTRFPGQHARCWYCGRPFVWGANGQSDGLMCNGARSRECWNAIGFKGGLAARLCSALVTEGLNRLETFDGEFRAMLARASQGGDAKHGRKLEDLGAREAGHAKAKSNITAAIAEYGPNPILKQKLEELDREEERLRQERMTLERRKPRPMRLPDSAEELRVLIEERFAGLAADSPEYGNLLRRLVPDIHVYLVRLVDGGHPLPRARVRLNLAGFLPDLDSLSDPSGHLAAVTNVDLFDPPQREQIRAEAIALGSQGLTQDQIADRLGVTQAAVSRAVKLDREMKRRGLESPYVLVDQPPADYKKLCRHQDPRYRFAPLGGYEPPSI